MRAPEGGTVSLKTLAAPKDARKAWEKAGKELQKKSPDFSKVTKELEKAVDIYPEFASAWQMLGDVRLAQNDRPAASEAFEQAKAADSEYANPYMSLALMELEEGAADSEYANPYMSLALMELEEGRWQEAADLCSQALELNPQLTKAHYLNSLAHSSLGSFDVAEESAMLVLNNNQAQAYPLTYYVLGFAESQKGNFPSAAARYQTFLEMQPNASLSAKLRAQLDQWQKQGLIQ
jgi:tetratricopeptide (TPR) repeat protein